MALFLIIVLSVWTLQNAYVVWRVHGLLRRERPWQRGLFFFVVGFLYLSYPAARMSLARGWEELGTLLEIIGSTWIGILFLLVASFLFLELVTLGGFLFRTYLQRLRLLVLVCGLGLSILACVQGHRAPQVRESALRLANLPAELSGLRVVALSDLHLGRQFDEIWLASLVAEINALKPDLVLLSGDIVDGDFERVREMHHQLGRLQARRGVWAVLGNHDYYAGPSKVVGLLEKAGVRVLRDQAIELQPGLWIAGVDDLPTASVPSVQKERLQKTFSAVPKQAACLYLSHTPVLAEEAGRLGADFMFSGHTHGGQIWPFSYLVKLRYPLFVGHYDLGDSQVLVSRGAGGWGPRMRLWQPGEMHLLQFN